MHKFVSAVAVGSMLFLSMSSGSFAQGSSALSVAAGLVKTCATTNSCPAAIKALKEAMAAAGLSGFRQAALLAQAQEAITAQYGGTLPADVVAAVADASADIDPTDGQLAGDTGADCSLSSGSANDFSGC